MVSADDAVLRLAYPISANRYWKTFQNRQVVSKEARAYKAHVKYQADKKQVRPSEDEVSLLVLLHPKLTKKGEASKAVIDLDNCLKVVVGALQGVFYHNDEQVKFITVLYGEPVKDGGLTVKRMPRRVVAKLKAVLEGEEEADDERNP